MIKHFMRQFFAKPSKRNPYNFTQMKNLEVGGGGIMSTSRGGGVVFGEKGFAFGRGVKKTAVHTNKISENGENLKVKVNSTTSDSFKLLAVSQSWK